jgi:hypothetical protein
VFLAAASQIAGHPYRTVIETLIKDESCFFAIFFKFSSQRRKGREWNTKGLARPNDAAISLVLLLNLKSEKAISRRFQPLLVAPESAARESHPTPLLISSLESLRLISRYRKSAPADPGQKAKNSRRTERGPQRRIDLRRSGKSKFRWQGSLRPVVIDPRA